MPRDGGVGVCWGRGGAMARDGARWCVGGLAGAWEGGGEHQVYRTPLVVIESCACVVRALHAEAAEVGRAAVAKGARGS